jgi:hypothetical protein
MHCFSDITNAHNQKMKEELQKKITLEWSIRSNSSTNTTKTGPEVQLLQKRRLQEEISAQPLEYPAALEKTFCFWFIPKWRKMVRLVLKKRLAQWPRPPHNWVCPWLVSHLRRKSSASNEIVCAPDRSHRAANASISTPRGWIRMSWFLLHSFCYRSSGFLC